MRLALLAVVTAACVFIAPHGAAYAARPNIVVVMTDDQDAASVTPRTMPNLTRLLKRSGTSFDQHIASGPLCCPSRAVMLTGQYGHNNGIMWNDPSAYSFLRDKGNTLPVWLQRVGYRTAHLGKYLHDFHNVVGDPNAVAPGWSDWQTVLQPVSYYNYVLSDNGRPVYYGERDDDYLTRVLNQRAVRLIDRYAPRAAPLFLAIDHFAPHRSGYRDPRCGHFASPDRLDRRAFLDEPLPRPPSFNEPDMSDKPSFSAGRRRIGRSAIAAIAREHRCRLAALKAVDRGVAQVDRALARAGEADDTVFLFTSDNGWFAGQHRIRAEKIYPYEEALRVPLIVRLPARLRHPESPRTSSAPVANVDIVPTLLELAGARPCRSLDRCRTLDGRSLVGLLRGHDEGWPVDRGLLLELRSERQRVRWPFTPCDYAGIRAAGQVYIEHRSATAAKGSTCRPVSAAERYDLAADPFQLHNLAPAAPGTLQEQMEAGLRARLEKLRRCAGIEGRDPPRPDGYFCE